MPRLHGFIHAIKRWPEQQGVLDVGSGAFPILALAAAVYHPHADVVAVEIDAKAALAATKMTELFGLSNRLAVINTDFADYAIDRNTTAAVTETFDAGLQAEPGPKIIGILGKEGIQTITPSAAVLLLQTPADKEFLQHVDLRRDTHADIMFDCQGEDLSSVKSLNIYTAYYDDFGLVLPVHADTIICRLGLRPRFTLKNALTQANGPGRLVYELGTRAFEPRVLA